MKSSELGSLLRSRSLMWCLAGAGGLFALSYVLLLGIFPLALVLAHDKASIDRASVDLGTAALWLGVAANWVALFGFGAATWEAFVATGHGELLAWRAAGVVATFVLALGALLTTMSVFSQGTPGRGSGPLLGGAGNAIWAVLLLAAAARLVVAAGPGEPGGRRPVPKAVAGLALGAAALVVFTVAVLLSPLPPTLPGSTSAIASEAFAAIAFGLGAIALVKAGLVKKVPYLLAGLIVAAAARLGYAIAASLLFRPTVSVIDQGIGFGILLLALAAGYALAGSEALVAASADLALAPAWPAPAEGDQRSATPPPPLRRCGACGELASASARFCAGCGRAL